MLLRPMLDAILDAVGARLVEFGGTLPERRYWTWGDPALDCAQLVVEGVQILPGSPGGSSGTAPYRCAVPQVLTVNIWLTRCIPTLTESGTAPTAATLEASAVELAADADALRQAFADARGDGALGGCEGAALVGIFPIPPEGGIGGTRLVVEVGLG